MNVVGVEVMIDVVVECGEVVRLGVDVGLDVELEVVVDVAEISLVITSLEIDFDWDPQRGRR